MNTLEALGFIGLLAYMLFTQLGRREVTQKSFTRPLIVAVAIYIFLVNGAPTDGGNLDLEIAGGLVGVLLGLLASSCVRLDRAGTAIFSNAGAAYATVWVCSIGARLLFGWAAFHGLGASIWQFSVAHHIATEGWKAAFGLMTMLEIAARSGSVAWRTNLLRASDLGTQKA